MMCGDDGERIRQLVIRRVYRVHGVRTTAKKGYAGLGIEFGWTREERLVGFVTMTTISGLCEERRDGNSCIPVQHRAGGQHGDNVGGLQSANSGGHAGWRLGWKLPESCDL